MIDMSFTPESFETLDKLIADLEGVILQLHTLKEPLEIIKKHQIQQWATNFDEQGAMYQPWTELSATWTIPERINRGFGPAPILVRTGYMQEHFLQQNAEGVVDDLGVQWNFNDVPGAYTVRHDEGYDNPIQGRRPIPGRLLWDINNKDEQFIQDEMELYVNKVLADHYL